ncbi:MAG: acetylxylan esterase [Planctomycetia bacterium]|nr:acetylxylan esterase [Planctomycetia bacterium]
MLPSRWWFLGLFCLVTFSLGSAETVQEKNLTEIMRTNYEESQVPIYVLPNPLVCEDGTPVASAEIWENRRRPELLKLLETQMFGEVPETLRGDHPPFVTFEVMEEDTEALGGKAIRRQVAIHFAAPQPAPHKISATDPVRKSFDSLEHQPAGEISIPYETALVLIYLPKKAERPVPCFLGMNFRGNQTIWNDPGIFPSEIFPDGKFPPEKERGVAASRWNVEKILDAGYGLVTLYYQDIVPDRKDCFQAGLFSLYGSPSRTRESWGAISAWAWALSRVMDYIEQDSDLDSCRVALMGHSRLGKTALWAGACDPRFAIVISNNSGCGGAALSRREYGERVIRINHTFPHWFCLNFHAYGEEVSKLPFDQHELIALMAPRPVYITSAEEDRWADPKGEYLSAWNAVPVYRLLGTDAFGEGRSADLPPLNQSVGATIGYHIRNGKHDVTDFDWEQFIRFANRHFQR